MNPPSCGCFKCRYVGRVLTAGLAHELFESEALLRFRLHGKERRTPGRGRVERAVKLWRFWNRKALGHLAPSTETSDLHFGTSAGPSVQGNVSGTNGVQK